MRAAKPEEAYARARVRSDDEVFITERRSRAKNAENDAISTQGTLKGQKTNPPLLQKPYQMLQKPLFIRGPFRPAHREKAALISSAGTFGATRVRLPRTRPLRWPVSQRGCSLIALTSQPGVINATTCTSGRVRADPTHQNTVDRLRKTEVGEFAATFAAFKLHFGLTA